MPQGRIKIAVFLLFAPMLLSACSKQLEDWVNVRGRLPATLPSVPIEPKTTAASEFVPGSRQYTQTLQRGYYVSSSVAGSTPEVVQKSARGYKIYSSVQGVMVSAE